jgi:integrase/recombinase XerD
MNTLREAVGEYLEMRRGLGFKLQEAGKGLINFITFLEQHHASYITQELALAWAQQPSNVQPAHSAQRLSFVREFARFRSATDPRTQIPLQGLLPFQPKRARPYLYSDEEIRSLLRAALKMPCRFERGKLRPWVYYCLFALLSLSDLRLGEARNLELQDADLKAAVLTIRGTKFGNTRLVPLHASTCTVLADYIARRQRHWAGRAVSSYLFVSSWGNRLDEGDIHRTFYALSRQIGLRGTSESRGPRLHDMRHRFATTTLVQWYRSGQDPERRLPLLSTYLGHVHVSDTQWYLEGSPELMREAMQRLQQRWEDRPLNAPISLAALLERFFTQRLMQQRQASPHTISSYRDTFHQFLKFTEQRLRKEPSRLVFQEIDAPLITAFLDHLEKHQGLSTRSRNLRLTALRSFFRFAAFEAPTHSAQIQRVLAIPSKRFTRTLVQFLTRA